MNIFLTYLLYFVRVGGEQGTRSRAHAGMDSGQAGCGLRSGTHGAPMLLLRPDEQEMTAFSCRELLSPLSDDFVLMGGCSMGRWGWAAEILLGHLWAVAYGRGKERRASLSWAKGPRGSSPFSQGRWAHGRVL